MESRIPIFFLKKARNRPGLVNALSLVSCSISAANGNGEPEKSLMSMLHLIEFRNQASQKMQNSTRDVLISSVLKSTHDQDLRVLKSTLQTFGLASGLFANLDKRLQRG
jgi:hypothetical protein